MRLANNRLVELIGWLSLCLLAAAWGPSMDTGWRQLWGIFGVFGLISAAGLEAVQRVRRLQEEKRSRSQALVRYENAMEEIQRQKKADAEVQRVTRRIAEFAAQQHVTIPDVDLADEADEQAAANRRTEKRTKCALPVEVLVTNAEGRYVSWAEDDSHKAYIRDISPGGIGLLHNTQVDAHRVVLRVALENNELVSLSVCLLWCRPLNEGWFSSGGKVSEVITGPDAPFALPATEQSGVSDQLAAGCPLSDDALFGQQRHRTYLAT